MIRWKKAAAAAAIAVTTALARRAAPAAAPRAAAGEGGGGSLILGAIAAPTTYDPSGAEWGNRSPFYQAVFDTLLLATPEGTIEPWLATEWSYNEDNTVLTLTLRDDVTFTDGSELTGEVVVEQPRSASRTARRPTRATSPASRRSRPPTTRPSSSPSRHPTPRCSTT